MELGAAAKDIARRVQTDLTESGKTGGYEISMELYSQGIVTFVIDEIEKLFSLDEAAFNGTFIVQSDIRKTRVEGSLASQAIDLSKLNITRL